MSPTLQVETPANNPATVSTPSEDRRVSCVCGFRAVGQCESELTTQTALFVRSPRTGRELLIRDRYFPELRQQAPRVIGKIAQARAVGQPKAEFTTAELHAVLAVVTLVAEKTAPKPKQPATLSLFNGWRRKVKGYRRRGW
jgi:hypothetical protein